MRELLRLEAGQDERVDRVPRPVALLHRRGRRPTRRLEGPVLVPFRPLIDPLLEDFDLMRSQHLPRFPGRHQLVRVATGDPVNHLALPALPRHDDRFLGPERAFLGVQPQVGLSGPAVGTMTEEAVIRQDRQDLLAEIHRGRIARQRPGRQDTDGHQAQEKAVPTHRDDAGIPTTTAVSGRRFRSHASFGLALCGGRDRTGGRVNCIHYHTEPPARQET